jgi:hypothetical protein
MFKQPETGCMHLTFDAPQPRLKPVALVQLIATVTLALCTLLVATAVSIGLARAEIAPAPGANMAPIAVSLVPVDDAAFRS